MHNPRVLVITGAGVSAESGIATFRGKDGYWRNLNPATLATPEAFDRDPKLVWQWYRERRVAIRKAEPNPAHVAITRLANHCDEFLLVTQNVDNLHARAVHDGRTLSSDKMVQIHGDIFVTRCSRCDFQFHELENDSLDLSRCRECGAMMRPGVVLFGEMLDRARVRKVEKFLASQLCNIVLVVGTTAMFGYIVDWAVRAAGTTGRLIEINPDTTSLSDVATESIREPAGVALPNLVSAIVAEH
jgi:NAD-dependent deacetylase